jgi:hypothetical protein
MFDNTNHSPDKPVPNRLMHVDEDTLYYMGFDSRRRIQDPKDLQLPHLHITDGSEVIDDKHGHRTQIWRDKSGSVDKVQMSDGELWTRQVPGRWTDAKGHQFSGTVSADKTGVHFVGKDDLHRYVNYRGEEIEIQPSLNFRRLYPALESAVVKADADHNGFASSSELAQAVKANKLHGLERQALEALNREAVALHNLGRERIDLTMPGVSLHDIRAFRQEVNHGLKAATASDADGIVFEISKSAFYTRRAEQHESDKRINDAGRF